MPYASPAPGDVHVNRPLTNIAIAYMQDQAGYVADRVFPNIPVTHQSDAYFTFNRGDWNRDDVKERAPGTESAGTNFEIGEDSYFAKVKALHYDIADQMLANQAIRHLHILDNGRADLLTDLARYVLERRV